jgi:Cd2+/Zn2+-exporting ATPase
MDKKHDHEEDCCCEKDEHHHDECCCHHDHEHEEHDECCCHDHEDEHHHEHKGHSHGGCGCSCCHHEEKSEEEEKKEMIINIIRVAISAVLVGVSYVKFDSWIPGFILCIVAYLILVYDVLIRAVKNIIHGEVFDENFLMLIATVGAMAIKEFQEGVLVLLFYHVGEMLEDYATAKSHESIVGLIDNMPLLAHVVTDDGIVEKKPEEVEIGTVIEVRPGEKIALDGEVVSGNTTLDLSSLTGESIPQDASVGTKVYSGTINNDGLIRIKTTKEFSDSTLSKILDLVENEESKKSKSESFISRFAKIYTPVVILIALLTFLIPSIIARFDSRTIGYLYQALNMLIISCPCSLVISVPLAFFAGMGKASRLGVLIKGSLAIENMAKAENVVFDKTGTLTTGQFQVRNVIGEDTMRIASALEAKVSHPIAKAVVKASGESDLVVEEFENIKGEGVTGKIDGVTYYLGNASLLSKHGVEVTELNSPFKVLYLGSSNGFVGSIEIADTIKDTTKDALADLKYLKVKNEIMLSGDNAEICKKVAEEVGIDETYGELMPDQKLSKLAEIKTTGKTVFVGDGMNDSPSLLSADVGVAMGGLGSDAAIESADAVVMNDDLLKVAEYKRLSKKVMLYIYEDILGILLVKVLFLVLAMLGKSNMILAILADVGVLVLAVLNSLRIMLYKSKYKKSK